MKVDVHYDVVHEAIRKIRMDEPLSTKEKNNVLAVLYSIQGDYIPSEDEMKLQEMNVRNLEKAEPNSDSWKRIMSNITEFENKFC